MSNPNEPGPSGQQPEHGQPVPPPAEYANLPPAPPVDAAYAAPTARPGAVTAAAVIAFIIAGLEVLGALLAFVAGVGYSNLTQSQKDQMPAMASSGTFYLMGLFELVFAGLLIWGGVAAIQGKTNKILFFVALAVAVLNVVYLFVGGYLSIVGVIIAVVIMVLLRQQSSKQWFLSRGGTAV